MSNTVPVPQPGPAGPLEFGQPVIFNNTVIFNFPPSGISGITSINGDFTPAQFIIPQTPNLGIVDSGANHTLQVLGVVEVRASPPGVPQTVPVGVETAVASCSFTAGDPGKYYFAANCQSIGLSGTSTIRLRLLNGAAQIGAVTVQMAPGLTILEAELSLNGGTLNLAGGETIQAFITLDASLIPSLDFIVQLYVVYLGL